MPIPVLRAVRRQKLSGADANLVSSFLQAQLLTFIRLKLALAAKMNLTFDDEEFERLKQRIEAEKTKRASPGYGLPPNQRASSFVSCLKTRDYHTLRICVAMALEEKQDVSVHERCALGFSEAYLTGVCYEDLYVLIQADPLLPMAYCAYALMASSAAECFPAERFMQLAQLCGGDIAEHWYQSTQAKIKFDCRRTERFMREILPCFLQDDKLALLKAMYPEAEEMPDFGEVVAKLRAEPSKFVHFFAKTPALRKVCYAVFRDTSPEILASHLTDTELTALVPLSATGLSCAPQAVITCISSFLTLNEQSTMRQSCGIMNGRFDHWSVWRRYYLNSVRHADESTAFYGPVAPLDWKTMSRLMSFAKLGLNCLENFDANSGGLASTSFPTESHRDTIRHLIETHRIPMTSASDFLTPERLWFYALEIVCFSDKTTNSMNAISFNQLELSFVLRSMIQCKEQGRFETGPWTAANFAASLLWRSPAADYLLNLFRYSTGIEMNAFMSAGPTVSAVRVASYWALGEGITSLKQYPMGLPSPTFFHRRRPDLPENLALQTSSVPYSSLIAGVPSRTTVAGIYHFFISYNIHEIRKEQDRGIMELFQDPVTHRISGSGFDSLRGSFKVRDARSESTIQKDTERRLEDQRGLYAPRYPFSNLIIEYDEDGTKLTLIGTASVWSFSGRIGLTQDPDAEDHQLTAEESFGDFALLYDQAMSQLTGTERENALNDQPPICLGATVRGSSHLEDFLPYHFVRPVGSRFQPWDHIASRTNSVSVDYHLRYLKSLMVMMAVLRENPSKVTLFEIRHNLEPLANEIGNMDMEFPVPLMSPDWETEENYAERRLVWSIACHCCYFTLLSIAASFDVNDLNRSISNLKDPQRRLSVYRGWVRTLRLHPAYPFFTADTIGTFLAAAIELKSHIDSTAPSSDEAFDFSLVKSRAKPRSSLLSWINSPVGIASAILGLGIITGAVAFGLGIFLGRKTSKK